MMDAPDGVVVDEDDDVRGAMAVDDYCANAGVPVGISTP